MDAKPKKPVSWTKIRVAYESGQGTYRQLAAKFGVSFSTLEKRARVEGWAQGKRQGTEKLATELRQKATDRIVKKTLSDMEMLDGTIARLYAALDEVEPKSLEGAANAIARVIEAKAKLLNPADGGDRPDGFKWTRLIIEKDGNT